MNHLKSLVMMPIMKYSLFPSLCFTSQQQLFLPFTLFYSSWLTWLLLRCFYYEKKWRRNLELPSSKIQYTILSESYRIYIFEWLSPTWLGFSWLLSLSWFSWPLFLEEIQMQSQVTSSVGRLNVTQTLFLEEIQMQSQVTSSVGRLNVTQS